MLGLTPKPVSAGGVFLLCLFIGILTEQVALGILGGLFFGAMASQMRPPGDRPDA